MIRSKTRKKYDTGGVEAEPEVRDSLEVENADADTFIEKIKSTMEQNKKDTKRTAYEGSSFKLTGFLYI